MDPATFTQRYCASDNSYSSQAAYNCYLLPNGMNKQTRRHTSSMTSRGPALLTMLNKIPFISTK